MVRAEAITYRIREVARGEVEKELGRILTILNMGDED